MENTAIEWCDSTWSAWIGCTNISPGCDHCYAEAMNRRFSKGANWGPGAPRRRTAPENWKQPGRWQRTATRFFAAEGRKRRVFLNNQADIFDNAVEDQWRQDVWQVIRETPDIDWIIVTKRIGNAARMLPPDLVNVTVLITVVNQEEADRDIPKLRALQVQRRGLSMEPLLGPVDLTAHLSGLHWVIVGGESGPSARAADSDWFYALLRQCRNAGVPFFMKQMARRAFIPIDLLRRQFP